MTILPPNEVPKAEASKFKYVLASIIFLIGIAVIAAIILSTMNDDDEEPTTEANNVDQVQGDENESSANSMDDDATDFMDCRYDDEACFSTWLGLEQGVSADGIPTIGSDAAPIIIGEFGDFGCPHCLAFAPTFEALVRDYAGSGEAQFYYFPLAFVRGENSVIAADAAICSLDQGAFWQMHEVLFEIQATQTYEAFTVENLVTVAAGLGLDGDGLRDCMLSDQPAVVRDMAQGAGDAAGVTGTPTIVFSVDGGATWTVIEDRSEASIRSLIEGASLEA